MSGGRWRAGLARALAAAGAAACAVAAPLAAPAAATPSAAAVAQSEDCAPVGEPFQAVPWSQRMVAAERVWPFTQGRGVTVAVLASGVDAGHPRLAGRVREGFDAVAGAGPADTDCIGLGTQVAGVIAARRSPEGGFAGVAPQARILPVRVVDGRPSSNLVAEPEVLASGIRWAAARADVIVVAVPAYRDHDDLEASVSEAVDAGVLVVAAAGDLAGETDGNPAPYPAVYPDVLGVGAVGPDALRWPDSQYGPYVDLVAPGAAVVTLQRGDGMVTVDGTGVAAGFVAGAAALVRGADRDASPREIAHRLTATATPAPGGSWSPQYGRGVVNPYAAVHDRLVTASPSALPAATRPVADEHPEWERSRDVAVAGSLGALVLVVAVLTAAAALPRGRRRLWRPAIAPAPPADRQPEEPGPPVQLFDES